MIKINFVLIVLCFFVMSCDSQVRINKPMPVQWCVSVCMDHFMKYNYINMDSLKGSNSVKGLDNIIHYCSLVYHNDCYVAEIYETRLHSNDHFATTNIKKLGSELIE